MANKVLVMAESYEHLQQYVKNNRLNMGHFGFFIGRDQMAGYRGAVILLGRWWRNKAYLNTDFRTMLGYYQSNGNMSFVKVALQDDDVDLDFLGSIAVPPSTPPSTPQYAYS